MAVRCLCAAVAMAWLAPAAAAQSPAGPADAWTLPRTAWGDPDLQTPGYVVVWTENIHDARIVPLDGRPRIAGAIRQWMGDSRGRWDGGTLVVETTHFNGKAAYRGSADDLHVVERFTRTGADALDYAYTVAGADTYVRPWTAALTMKRLDTDLYEFACHEGNYGLVGILAGARAEEREAAAAR